MVKLKLKNLILILISLLVLSEGAFARSPRKGKHANLKMSQTKKVSKSPKMAAIDPQTARLLYMADESSARLDGMTQELIKISSLSAWQRWVQNKDAAKLKNEFSSEMQRHLGIVSDIFRIRSAKGRLPQYQEFEFQNLLRKSDYLLSLDFSRDSLEYARKNKDFSASFSKTLVSYNEQRFNYDRKTIAMKL